MAFDDIKKFLQSKPLNDRELARVIRESIRAEHDAVQLYELIADSTNNAKVKKLMKSIADEEKIHVGEFEKLLTLFDSNNENLVNKGKEEAKDIVSRIASEILDNK